MIPSLLSWLATFLPSSWRTVDDQPAVKHRRPPPTINMICRVNEQCAEYCVLSEQCSTTFIVHLVNKVGTHRSNTMHYAVACADAVAVERFLSMPTTNVNALDGRGNTPLAVGIVHLHHYYASTGKHSCQCCSAKRYVSTIVPIEKRKRRQLLGVIKRLVDDDRVDLKFSVFHPFTYTNGGTPNEMMAACEAIHQTLLYGYFDVALLLLQRQRLNILLPLTGVSANGIRWMNRQTIHQLVLQSNRHDLIATLFAHRQQSFEECDISLLHRAVQVGHFQTSLRKPAMITSIGTFGRRRAFRHAAFKVVLMNRRSSLNERHTFVDNSRTHGLAWGTAEFEYWRDRAPRYQATPLYDAFFLYTEQREQLKVIKTLLQQPDINVDSVHTARSDIPQAIKMILSHAFVDIHVLLYCCTESCRLLNAYG